jgi:hypothetical protein
MKIHTCLECEHSKWLVAVGQGFRCACPENEYRDLGGDKIREIPMIPNRQFCCEHFSVKQRATTLTKLIFRLQDITMDGGELTEEQQVLLEQYKKMLEGL